jgi:outer membrane protein insertion porin family
MKKIFFIILLVFTTHVVANEEAFVVNDIKLQGLQKVDPGTVYAYLPIEIGDTFYISNTTEIIKILFKTGFFDDIVIERKKSTLIISFVERPTMASIEFEGLEDIKEEQIQDVLMAAGIQPGKIFNESVLEKIRSELLEQYYARGKYSVKININETILPNNQISIIVYVKEGEFALLKSIKITGNKTFSDEELLSKFDSALPTWYEFWKDAEKYASPVLDADIRNLFQFYQDKGFIDRVTVSGKLIVNVKEIANLIIAYSGEYVSRSKINKSVDNIKLLLGEHGYAFASVNAVPKTKKESKLDLDFFIDPGKRVYIRRIEIKGNVNTADKVIRRELRQMEGGWYSNNLIELSKKRIQRLAFVEDVSIQEKRVSGKKNMMDLVFNVKEQMSGNFNLGAGFGGSGTGVQLNTSVSQDNFLGTGNKVSFAISTAKTTKNYSFSFFNPYHNLDNVSRGFGFSFRTQDTTNTDTETTFKSDSKSLSFNYGIPMTEDNRINFDMKAYSYNVDSDEDSAQEVLDFITKNGDTYTNAELSAAYTIDTRNRSSFTTSGFKTTLKGTGLIPGSDIEYFKLSFGTSGFFEIDDDLILKLSSKIAGGSGYGQQSKLPFFDKYKTGGPKSVRGYEKNSLSPKDSRNQPLGGDFMFNASAELRFPTPLLSEIEELKNLQSGLFVDFGRAYEDVEDFDIDEIRGSLGYSLSFISPLGGITINFSVPFNDDETDKTEGFQFRLGSM